MTFNRDSVTAYLNRVYRNRSIQTNPSAVRVDLGFPLNCGLRLHLSQLALKSPGRPKSGNRNRQSEKRREYISPFRFFRGDSQPSPQALTNENQYFTGRWLPFAVAGLVLRTLGGLVLWCAVHVTNRFLGRGVILALSRPSCDLLRATPGASGLRESERLPRDREYGTIQTIQLRRLSKYVHGIPEPG